MAKYFKVAFANVFYHAHALMYPPSPNVGRISFAFWVLVVTIIGQFGGVAIVSVRGDQTSSLPMGIAPTQLEGRLDRIEFDEKGRIQLKLTTGQGAIRLNLRDSEGQVPSLYSWV